jgi:EAL domain-containing protein (putative c-di-GMP-specific phosphodiesterase class I)
MAVEQAKIQESVLSVYYASQDVLEAVRALLMRTEALEEEVLRNGLSETEMSNDELKALDKSLHEMREEGVKITLDEFNKHQGCHKESRSEIQSERSSNS